MRLWHSILASLRSLPTWVEFALVIGIAFGSFFIESLLSIPIASQAYVVSWSDFTAIAVFEVATALVIGLLLAARGWRLADLGFDRPTDADIGSALVLLAASYAVTYMLWYFVPTFTRETAAFGGFELDKAQANFPVLLAFPVINAIFEETFVCAYVISAWRGRAMWDAITASAVIRIAYHTYQGPLAIITIGPLGLIFAWYYATRGRIWPLVFAHALSNFFTLYAIYQLAILGPE